MPSYPSWDGELRELYQSKGHKALVWLAWRAAAKYLPLLVIEIDQPEDKEELWNEFVVKFLYLATRPIIANELFNPSTSLKDIKYESLYSFAHTSKTDLSYSIIRVITCFHEVLDGDKHGSSSSLFKILSKYSGRIDDELRHFDPDLADYYDNSLKQDLVYVRNNDFKINSFDESDSPSSLVDYKKRFLLLVQSLSLPFLANDLEYIWEGGTYKEHFRHYLKDISEADLNNPEALGRIILGDEADKIHAVRALLLGPGGAGKSSLADRLQGIPFDGKLKPATQGIEYQNHQPLDLQKTFPESNPEEKDLNLYLWDFGGQTIFHGLHRAFLHENCVYILVVDSRHEQVPDEWLHQIRHLAGGNATVLLVTNQHDGCDIRQNETRLLREFPDLLDNNSFYYFSCIDSTASELTTFVNELTKTALGSQKAVWKETLNVHRAIREYTEKQSAVFISMSQIKKIISDNGRVEDSKAMINSLEQLGFLASITKGNLSYCLKPEWAVDRAYQLLYSDTLRDSAGKLDLLNFDECFETEPTEEQQSKLLDFLDHRSLCFQLPESGEYFFPDAATADEPEIVTDLLKQQQRLQIRFDLPYLPLGFHTRLVKPLFDQDAGIKDSQHIWRQGFITQRAESYAIVQYLLRKSSIEVTLVGSPEHYATLLDKFYSELSSAVAESKTRPQSFAIRPFVFLEKGLFELNRAEEPQAFSVHSVVELVKVLQAANGDLKQVYEDVRDMAAGKKDETHHHYHDKVFNTDISGDGQNAVGSDNATMNQYIDKSHIAITADQRHQIATVVGELLKDAGSLPTEQLIAVTETKKALEAPVDDAASQNLLGKVLSGINGVATFTKDTAMPITAFAIKHKESLGAAFAAAKAMLNNP